MYAAHADDLPHRAFGCSAHSGYCLVRPFGNAVLSLCWGTASLSVVQRCFSSGDASSLLRNSHPQSAWICETVHWLLIAFSNA